MKRRKFTERTADEIEKVLVRNDVPRPGHEDKGPWETVDIDTLHKKLDEEIMEFLDSLHDYQLKPNEENRKALQWECADAGVTLFMISANVDPELSELRRGR